MNQKEKEWIRKNLKQIFVIDVIDDTDEQTEHALEFLYELAGYVEFDQFKEEQIYMEELNDENYIFTN